MAIDFWGKLKSDNISSQKFPHFKTFSVKKTRNLQHNIPFGAWGPWVGEGGGFSAMWKFAKKP